MFSGRSIRLAVKARSWNPTQTEWKHAAQCVQLEEKDRIGKFIFKKDAKSAMVGRLLLRYAISNILKVPYRSLKFDRTDKGKPFLASPVDRTSPRCDISFNISHQGDYVVFAAEKGSVVGVDIMKVEWPSKSRKKPVSDFFSQMERQLTQHEWSEVNKRTGEMEQLKTFYRLWCLKESVVKAYGTGIGFEVCRLEFHFKTPELSTSQITCDTQVEIDGDLATEWKFEETMLEDHCVAVAINKPSTEATDPKTDVPSFHILDIEKLLEGCEPLAGNPPDMEYWEEFSGRQEEPGFR